MCFMQKTGSWCRWRLLCRLYDFTYIGKPKKYIPGKHKRFREKMEERIDKLIEELETTNTELNKLNFDIEGLQEEINNIEEKTPFMKRQLQTSQRKLLKLAKKAAELQFRKRDLDAEYGAFQLKRQQENLEKAIETNPNTNIEEKPIKDEEFGFNG